jgi:O-antigen ligase
LGDITVNGKYFYFAFFIAAATPVTVYFLLQRKATFRLCLTDIAVLCFVAWVAFCCVVNRAHPGMNLWLLMLLVTLYIIVRSSLQVSIRMLLLIIVGAATVEAIWGLLQLHGFLKSYHSWFATTGSFFNPGPYAGFLACCVPLALYCIFSNSGKAEKRMGVACLVAVGLILPATMSRAAWLAVVAGCFPVLWKWFKVSSSKFQVSSFKFPSSVSIRIAAITVSVLLTVSLLAGAYMMKKQSVEGRLLVWRVSTMLIRENPLTGSGLGSFQTLFGDAQAEYFLSGKASEKQKLLADTPEYAFNEYVQITVESGIVGLLLFLGIIYSFFVKTRKGGDKPSPYDCTCPPIDGIVSAVRGSIIAFLVFAFFSYPFSVLPLTMLFVVLAAMSASLSQPINVSSIKNQIQNLIQKKIINYSACVLCLVLSGYASAQILSRYPAYRDWASVQILYDENHWEQAIDEYQRLYPKLKRQKQFLFEYARCLSATGKYEKSNEMFVRFLRFGSDQMIYNCMGDNYKNMGEYEKAEKMYLHASEIVPNLHYPLYLLMKLYRDSGQTEKAKLMANTLLEKTVTIPSDAINEIREEAKKVKNEK